MTHTQREAQNAEYDAMVASNEAGVSLTECQNYGRHWPAACCAGGARHTHDGKPDTEQS